MCGSGKSDRVRNRDDRLVEMMSAVLEKVTGMEQALSQKADLGVVDALEERLKALEEKFVIESRKPKRPEVANDQERELHEVESVARKSEKEKEIEKRRRNIVIRRVSIHTILHGGRGRGSRK